VTACSLDCMLTCLFRWLRSVTPIYRFSSSPLGFFFQQLCIPSTSVLIHCRFRVHGESLVTCELARSNGQPYCAGHLGYCWPPGIICGPPSDNVSATHKLEKGSLTDDTRRFSSASMGRPQEPSTTYVSSYPVGTTRQGANKAIA